MYQVTILSKSSTPETPVEPLVLLCTSDQLPALFDTRVSSDFVAQVVFIPKFG